MNTVSLVVMHPEEVTALIKGAVEEVLLAQQREPEPLLLDRAGIARCLGTSPSTVDRLRREGMPVVWIGESPRFEAQACLGWLRGHSGPPSTDQRR